MQLMINPTPCPGDALVIQQRPENPLNHLWVIWNGKWPAFICLCGLPCKWLFEPWIAFVGL